VAALIPNDCFPGIACMCTGKAGLPCVYFVVLLAILRLGCGQEVHGTLFASRRGAAISSPTTCMCTRLDRVRWATWAATGG
jgi:hypothetical protein